MINAGDAHWHPTQALVDAYTLCAYFGTMDLTGKTVGIIGDWRSRVAPSTEQALGLLGAKGAADRGPNGWGRKQGLGQTLPWLAWTGPTPLKSCGLRCAMHSREATA